MPKFTRKRTKKVLTIEHNGKTMTLSEAAKMLNISYGTAIGRYYKDRDNVANEERWDRATRKPRKMRYQFFKPTNNAADKFLYASKTA